MMKQPKPFELLITFNKASLFTTYNGAEIPDGTLQNATNCIFDNNVLETASGKTVIGTQLENGAAIDGIFRSWDKLGNAKLLAAVNGKIKYWTGATWTDLQTGLTVGPCDFLNYKNSTYIVNGYDAYEYIPRTNVIQKAGLEPPRFYIKAAYFEEDENISGDGYSLDSNTYRIDERTGNCSRSLKVTADAGQTKYGKVTYAARDLSTFPNGQAVTDNDYIIVWIFHRVLSYISSIFIDFAQDASNYFRATIEQEHLDPILQQDNQWTEVKIKRSAFGKTGNPSWSTINWASFSVTAAGGTAVVNFDNCYIKNTPIKATKYGKVIDDFDGPTSDWVAASGSVSYSSKYKRVKTYPGHSLVITNTNQNAYKGVYFDLTKFNDGATSQDSDEISLWVYIEHPGNLTSIELRLYSDTITPKYFSYPYTAFNSQQSWNEIRVKKSAFTNSGGASWTNIIRIYIGLATTGAVTCYFDDWFLGEYLSTRVLATMEQSLEDWTFSPTNSTHGYNTNSNFVSAPQAEHPSSIFMKVPCKKVYYTQLDWATKNLNQFDDGSASGDNDKICFWAYWTKFSSLKKIKILIDVNLFDFSTDFYYYEFDKTAIKALKAVQAPKSGDMDKRSLFFEVKKSDFVRQGSTSGKGWSTTEGVRFEITTIDKAGDPVTVYFDDLHMRRTYGITGMYQWCCVFADENSYSAPSEWSNEVELSGTRAILRNLPISQDSRVIKRLFFRKGGDLGSEARLDFILYDNTNTFYFTGNQDYQLTDLLDDERIPTGTIRFPNAAKWAGVYKGRGILYRDPSNLNRFYYSNIDYLYAWSEAQAWDMPSEITDMWIDDDILFINTKLGIKRLSVDCGEAQPSDFEETGIVKTSVNPYASTQCEEFRANILSDGVYLFNGYTHQYISEPIYKPYFDPTQYAINDFKIIYRKKHLYLSVKTVGGTRSILDCYVPKGQWRTANYPINCFCIADALSDNFELYGGSTDGYVYQLDTGTANAMVVTTKDYPISGNPFQECIFEECWVKAKSNDSSPGGVILQFRIDQSNTLAILTFPSTGDLTNTYKTYFSQLMGVQNYLKGSKIGLLIGQSLNYKKIEIESILLRGSIPELPKILEE